MQCLCLCPSACPPAPHRATLAGAMPAGRAAPAPAQGGGGAEELPCTQAPSLATGAAFLILKEAGCVRELGWNGREGGVY